MGYITFATCIQALAISHQPSGRNKLIDIMKPGYCFRTFGAVDTITDHIRAWLLEVAPPSRARDACPKTDKRSDFPLVPKELGACCKKKMQTDLGLRHTSTASAFCHAAVFCLLTHNKASCASQKTNSSSLI